MGSIVHTDWEGLIAPASTPAPLVARLSAEINKVMSSQEVRDYVANHGATAAGSTPEQLNERIRNEITLWTKVVKQSGLAIEAYTPMREGYLAAATQAFAAVGQTGARANRALVQAQS